MSEDESFQSQTDGRINHRARGAEGDNRSNKRSRYASKSFIHLSLPPFHPDTPTLNVCSYPFILSRIIEHSPPATLAALARCDKRLLHIAVPKLYQNVCMTRLRLATMLEAADTLATSSLTYDVPGRAVLQFIYGCLRDVRWLHLLEGGSTPRPTSLRSARLAHLTSIVVHPPVTAVGGGNALVVSADTKRLPAPSLVIWPDETDQRITKTLALPSLAKGIRSVTLLVPNAYWKVHHPPILQLNHHPGRDVTIVLLPSMLPDIPKVWGESAANHAWIDHLLTLSTRNDVRIIGVEYIVEHFAYCKSLMKRNCRAGSSRTDDVGEDNIQSSSFLDWLDEQEPGGLFNEQEERDLRAADIYMKGGCPPAGGVSGMASACDVLVLAPKVKSNAIIKAYTDTDEDSFEDDRAHSGKPGDDSDEDRHVYGNWDRSQESSSRAKVHRQAEKRDSKVSSRTHSAGPSSHYSRSRKKRVVSRWQSQQSHYTESGSPLSQQQDTPSPTVIARRRRVLVSSSPEETAPSPSRHIASLKRSLYPNRVTRPPTPSRSPVRRFRTWSFSPEGSQEAEVREGRLMQMAYA